MADSSTSQRRLAAIMFTDMVGYSALTQDNEELALQLLEEHRAILRPLLKKHGGTEIEAIGDGFFVEFDSGLASARCAIEIQQTLHARNSVLPKERWIRLRIGLHLGDVVHLGDKVHGDGVNIAARIEPVAPPGGICVSEDVARQIQLKTDIKTIKLGKSELKNIKAPVGLYLIVLPWEKQNGWTRQMSFLVRGHRRTTVFLLSVAVLAIVVLVILPSPRTPSTDRLSVAVLPFRNLHTEKETEYFSDGLTEEVIIQLSKVANLRIISRTSVMQYKNTLKKISEIAEELHVSRVLDGSVRREGSNIHIAAYLINADNDETLWQSSYDAELREIFSIQSDIAQKIVEALETTVTGDERARIAKRATINMDAYDLYLKGRFFWNQRNPDALNSSLGYFRRALNEDSTFAPAHAGLADAYTLMGTFHLTPPIETFPKAKTHARRALQLDSSLAEAHASLALVHIYYDRNWDAAESELKQALRLNPSYATARSWYGLFLTAMGRFNEATQMRSQAEGLDPLSTVIRTDAALGVYFERKYDDAIKQCKGVLDMNPMFAVAYVPMGGAFIQRAKYGDALEAFSKASLFSKGHPVAVAALGYTYAALGRKTNAEMMRDLLLERSEQEYVSPYWMAVLYVGLGEKTTALDWLEQAFIQRDGLLVYMNVDPIFDRLRREPRFHALVERMGFGVSLNRR